MYRETPQRLSADFFSAETLQSRREWHIFKVMKEKPTTQNILPIKALEQIW